MIVMNGVDSTRFAEALDDIEETLDAQEAFQEPFQTRMVSDNVRVLLDSRMPNGRRLRTA